MGRVLIIGSSGGLGASLVAACQRRGDAVTGLSRSLDGFDFLDPDAVDTQIGQLEGPFDLVFIATGALEVKGAVPEKSLKALTATAMMDQFAVNAVGPALILRHMHRLLPRDRPSVLAVLSARVGSIGDNRLGGWVSYRSAKAALNQIVRTAAIELARTHRQATLVALHPGTVATSLTEKYRNNHPTVTADEAAKNLLKVTDGLTVDQTGAFLDWAGVEIPW